MSGSLFTPRSRPSSQQSAAPSRPGEKGERFIPRPEAPAPAIARQANDEIATVTPQAIGKITAGKALVRAPDGSWLYDERGLFFRRSAEGWTCERFGPRRLYASLSSADRQKIAAARQRERRGQKPRTKRKT